MVSKQFKANKDIKVRLNLCTFTLTKDSVVQVHQTDTQFRKVLVDFGERNIGWLHESFLNDFTEV